MYKAVIFDFGNVILNVDPKVLAPRLMELGVKDLQGFADFFKTDNTYFDFEKGEVTPAEFREAIRKFFPDPIADHDLDALWNAMLLDIPVERFLLLEKLGRKYRTFLLSNTNSIHYEHYNEYCCREYHVKLDDMFEKAYYSYKMGVRKPDPETYLMVLRENDLIPEETLFIDDRADNIDAALELGINCILLDEQAELTELFDENLDLRVEE